jgi:hypothetical protein
MPGTADRERSTVAESMPAHNGFSRCPRNLGIILLVSGDPQEAVNIEACVIVPSRDLPRRVDGARGSACGAGGIE